jgi:menaquinone-dependent protoporphyrinogen oxidase
VVAPPAREGQAMTVLVAYGSKHGSTAEIAEAIAGTLRESGLDVDCCEAGDVQSLDRYDAVVLGSAVYMRRWRAGAKHFLRRHADALAARPFWVFSSGPVGEPGGDEKMSRWLEPPRVIRRVEELGARDHVVLGGRAPAGSAMEKSTPAEFRDRRDWDEIRGWARGIAAELGVRAGV